MEAKIPFSFRVEILAQNVKSHFIERLLDKIWLIIREHKRICIVDIVEIMCEEFLSPKKKKKRRRKKIRKKIEKKK